MCIFRMTRRSLLNAICVTYEEINDEITLLLRSIDYIVSNYELTDRTRELVSESQRNLALAKDALETAAGKKKNG